MKLILAKKEDFEKIYKALEKAFPYAERRTREDYLVQFGRPEFEVLLAYDGDTEVGFITVWRLEGFTYAEHFVTYEKHRNKGYGSRVLTLLKERFETIVLEAEHPESEIAERRLAFYKRNGFVINDCPYLQPSYHGERPLPLLLLSCPAALSDPEAVKTAIYRNAYGLEKSPSAIGLVLEGGGMKGMYTAGVLDVFLKNGINFDGVIGVSAGALHATSYLSSQAGRTIRYYKNHASDKRFVSMGNLIKTGDIIGIDFCYNKIPNVLDPFDYKTFAENGTDFFAVCTDVESGEARYLRVSDLKTDMDIIRASATLPFVSKPVKIGRHTYLDGGCTDGIPIEKFITMGYEKNVLVLTRNKEFVRKAEKPLYARFKYRKHKNFVNALTVRHERYNDTQKKIKELEKDGKVLVIRPESPLDIGRLENSPEKLQAVYDIGVRDAEKRLSEIKEFIKK